MQWWLGFRHRRLARKVTHKYRPMFYFLFQSCLLPYSFISVLLSACFSSVSKYLNPAPLTNCQYISKFIPNLSSWHSFAQGQYGIVPRLEWEPTFKTLVYYHGLTLSQLRLSALILHHTFFVRINEIWKKYVCCPKLLKRRIK